MKYFLKAIKANLFWFILLLANDLFFIIGLWVTEVRALRVFVTALIIFSIFGFIVACIYTARKEQKKDLILIDLLEDPTHEKCEELIRVAGAHTSASVYRLYDVLVSSRESILALKTEKEDREEYVEAWAHEAKTPIALLTLLMDNHADKFGSDINFKMEYIRCRLNESVDQMLQYARIKSTRKDYHFELLRIKDLINEVLHDYEPLLSEKDFIVFNKVKDRTVYADARGLRFMLGQFVSNSIKYCSDEPELTFDFDGNKLLITDNGIGVKACDLPYIFEKGFTGDTGEKRSKATGMGLYLAKKIAEDNKLKLDASTPSEGGLQIEIEFPEI
ncbi:MAG: sensor histidine kinase [Clostridiales bacterium]|nr:sensor histidine kinase [Clostridiales bacterium]